MRNNKLKSAKVTQKDLADIMQSGQHSKDETNFIY